MRKVLPRLKAGTVAVKGLSEAEREEMFALFEKYYSNVSYAEFQRDLNKKNDVIILREAATRQIKGFSTIMIMNMDLNGRSVKGIFSGDTIVDRQFWGQSTIHFEFARYFLLKRLKNPLTPYYWFLISKGYKTYLLLANNFTNYYPRFDEETPEPMRMMIEKFATELYPDDFDTATGLIRFPYESAHLKSHVASIDAHLLATNPKVAFFSRKNPDWAKGSELCCVGELSWSLPAFYLFKFLRKKFRPAVQVKDLDFIETPKAPQTQQEPAPERQVDLSL